MTGEHHWKIWNIDLPKLTKKDLLKDKKRKRCSKECYLGNIDHEVRYCNKKESYIRLNLLGTGYTGERQGP